MYIRICCFFPSDSSAFFHVAYVVALFTPFLDHHFVQHITKEVLKFDCFCGFWTWNRSSVSNIWQIYFFAPIKDEPKYMGFIFNEGIYLVLHIFCLLMDYFVKQFILYFKDCWSPTPLAVNKVIRKFKDLAI